MNTYLLDTNIFVYAVNSDAPFHKESLNIVNAALKGKLNCCISEKSLYEFYAVISDSRRIEKPLALAEIVGIIELIMKSRINILYSSTNSLKYSLLLAQKYEIRRQEIFDIVLVSNALAYGINKIITYKKKHFTFVKEIEVFSPEEIQVK